MHKYYLLTLKDTQTSHHFFISAALRNSRKKTSVPSKRNVLNHTRNASSLRLSNAHTIFSDLNDNIMRQGNVNCTYKYIDVKTAKLFRRGSPGIRINPNKRFQHRSTLTLSKLLMIDLQKQWVFVKVFCHYWLVHRKNETRKHILKN